MRSPLKYGTLGWDDNAQTSERLIVPVLFDVDATDLQRTLSSSFANLTNYTNDRQNSLTIENAVLVIVRVTEIVWNCQYTCSLCNELSKGHELARSFLKNCDALLGIRKCNGIEFSILSEQWTARQVCQILRDTHMPLVKPSDFAIFLHVE